MVVRYAKECRFVDYNDELEIALMPRGNAKRTLHSIAKGRDAEHIRYSSKVCEGVHATFVAGGSTVPMPVGVGSAPVAAAYIT